MSTITAESLQRQADELDARFSGHIRLCATCADLSCPYLCQDGEALMDRLFAARVAAHYLSDDRPEQGDSG